MKGSFWRLSVLLIIAGIVSCDDNPVCVCPDTYSITGRALYAGSLTAAEDVLVFISYGEEIHFSDTASTDSRGAFLFTDVQEGEFFLFAGKPDGQDISYFSYISPIFGELDNSGESVFCAGDLLLYEVFENASITGHVSQEGLPADGADVGLHYISVMDDYLAGTATTDEDGNYAFTDVMTGNYFLNSYKEGYYDESNIFFCDGISSYTAETLYIEQVIVVHKPAIYIYPDSDRDFQVRLSLVNGTELTASIPEYGAGWDVSVERSGIIEHKYDYLFYEASIRQAHSFTGGWNIHRENLPGELHEILFEIGLNNNETEDFLEYWLKRLTEYEYYSIYPIFDCSLDQYVELHVIPKPDAQLRFWLFFEGSKDSQVLPAPPVPIFQRGSTTVIEWGGVLVN